MGDRLVHQFVAQDGGFAFVATGYLAPDVAEQLLTMLALEEPGITITIVDVVTRLSTWAVVHIENQVEVVSLAPAYYRVDALVTVFLTSLPHIVFVSEESIVERQSDGVGTLISNEVDIGLGNIVILELLPELSRLVRTYGFLEEQVDHPSRIGTAESEHIAFRIKPVTQVRTLNEQFFTIGLYQVVALDGYKPRFVFLSTTCCAGSEKKEVRGKR